MAAVSINSGPTSLTPANEVPKELWPDLVKWRSYTTHRQIPKDCRALIFFLRDGESTGNWLGYGTRDAYLEALGISAETVKWALAGLKLLPDNGAPVPLDRAIELGRTQQEQAQRLGSPDGAPPAAVRKAGPGRGHKTPDNVRSLSNQYGNSAAHLTARIKRDRPDIAERMAAGEFPSVQAAARAAGIVRKSPSTGGPEAERAAQDYAEFLFEASRSQNVSLATLRTWLSEAPPKLTAQHLEKLSESK